ncbi:LPS export ABC transporter periplasmic protein LptC [Usitatibacter palustris]|uniref:Lipopolysaccharide export system protein LptC n=1 Tax=Usitatibacter palustris TaxID=2732487 RepID=A0A6M4H1B7_9PROT|nr:LPS export ABC transporter periplasmic protein LptC [Usitatibacter palustris]QJR13286.1 Lipopolysaccharide export system protein LptC [Usitatibacter palustris]
MIRPTTWLPLGVLALLVGLTVWLNTLVQPVAQRADGTGRHDPDLIVENFNARKLGEDGKVLYTLVARRMVHYPDDDSSHLQSLAFDAFEPKQPRVAITADSGRLEKGGDRVWIEGNVLVNREAAEKSEPVKLATERVLLLPDEGIARTTDEVKLESPSGHAVAAGFELNNKERTLRMDRVRATYKQPTTKR